MMAKYVLLKGSQYIDLPPEIKNSKAVINIQNDDDKCFLWSVLAYLNEASDHRYRVKHYEQHESKLNINGIAYPIAVKDVRKFESKMTHQSMCLDMKKDTIFSTFLEIKRKSMLTFYS